MVAILYIIIYMYAKYLIIYRKFAIATAQLFGPNLLLGRTSFLAKLILGVYCRWCGLVGCANMILLSQDSAKP